MRNLHIHEYIGTIESLSNWIDIELEKLDHTEHAEIKTNPHHPYWNIRIQQLANIYIHAAIDFPHDIIDFAHHMDDTTRSYRDRYLAMRWVWLEKKRFRMENPAIHTLIQRAYKNIDIILNTP